MEPLELTMTDPKDLAQKYAAKLAAKADEEAKRRAEDEAARSKVLAAEREGKKALAEVVIPYLTAVRNEFPADRFWFEAALVDERDHKPTAVRLRIGGGPVVQIAMNFGRVAISRFPYQETTRDRTGQIVRPRYTTPSQIYKPDEEPFIATPSDLTREKISKLIEIEMDIA
jgi:hypothetical protein